MASWLDRYMAGHCAAVWTEIVGLGGTIRTNPAYLADAEAVGRETMRRARRNVERLTTLLPEIGYEFDPGDGMVVFEPPPAGISAGLDAIERRVGLMPLALRWWFEEVGRVNLMGWHADWEDSRSDPLVVDAPADYIAGEIDAWTANFGTEWERQSFTIDFSPDDLHKANVSGGAPYSMALPNAGADGLVLWERHQTTFVNLIRLTFAAGGFLGWSGRDANWAEEAAYPLALARIAEDLEPL
jgi:hypothetical protein